MSRYFSEYTQQFFWNFKKMDNVNYNFEIIEILYKARQENSNDSRFNKPITIFLVAMIECMLEDFIVRIKTHRSETIPNLPQRVILYIRGKKIDRLGHLIAQTEKHNLLKVPNDDDLYNNLDFLRKARNRIHIQNPEQQLSSDEQFVFLNETREKAERTFERTCEVLCNIHPRWGYPPLPMADFPRPWV